jgi:RNA polymerase sigma factor (sigma-70 family)
MKPDPMNVYKLARLRAFKFLGKGVGFEELLNAAMLGACEACKVFNSNKGALSTIAVHYIDEELRKAVFKRAYYNNTNKRIVRPEDPASSEIEDYPDETLKPAYDVKLLEEINLKLNIILNKLTDRQSLAFKCYYYFDNFETYKYKYSSTEAQARKEASNVKVKIYKQIKELI